MTLAIAGVPLQGRLVAVEPRWTHPRSPRRENVFGGWKATSVPARSDREAYGPALNSSSLPCRSCPSNRLPSASRVGLAPAVELPSRQVAFWPGGQGGYHASL